MKKRAVIAIALSAFILLVGFGRSWAAEIHDAVKAGDLAKVNMLLEKDPQSKDSRDERDMSPLHYAAVGKRLDIIRLLVEHKADLENPGAQGRTPLIQAVIENAGLEVIGVLLDLGARIDAGDRFGYTPLLYAAVNGSADVVSLLLARNAAIPTSPPNGPRLLRVCVQKGLTDLFSRMVDKGADLLTVDEEGRTLLHDAAAGGHTAIIETLLDRKLDVNQRGSGWTPLHYAADQGHLAAIELLLARGADLQARTSIMGQTAANLADESGDQKALALLAAKGLALSPPTFPDLRGEYLGQTKPGRKAEVFAPGIVNVPHTIHSNIVFSPDGREAFWSFAFDNDRTMVSRLENGRWTYPRRAVFQGISLEDVPFFHPEGKTLYDLARHRPFPDGRKSDKENIWVWERGTEGWQNPKPLPAELNELPLHWQFSLDRQGNLYFSTRLPGSEGGKDIYVSRMVEGRYQKPENLGKQVNTQAGEDFPFISPDGRYLLFVRNMDIYVSFCDRDGQWSEARLLGPEVNTPGMEILPVVSPDGKYLFFKRNARIYWIDAGIIGVGPGDLIH